MIMMFMVLVVFVPSILVEGEGVDEGPLVALAVPTEPASSQRSTDQKNEADRLSENSHLGLQVVARALPRLEQARPFPLLYTDPTQYLNPTV